MTARAAERRALVLAIFLIASGAVLRVLRHYGVIDLPPNVAPVGAMALFAAVYLPRRLAVWVPLGLMLLSDALIGFDAWQITIAIYASFGMSLLLGFWLRRRVSPIRAIGATLLGSVIFFLVTNAAVWLFSKMYDPGWGGLWQSYIAGLPFFRNTVLGDLAYVGVLFGLYQAVVVYSRHRLVTTDSASTNG